MKRSIEWEFLQSAAMMWWEQQLQTPLTPWSSCAHPWRCTLQHPSWWWTRQPSPLLCRSSHVEATPRDTPLVSCSVWQSVPYRVQPKPSEKHVIQNLNSAQKPNTDNNKLYDSFWIHDWKSSHNKNDYLLEICNMTHLIKTHGIEHETQVHADDRGIWDKRKQKQVPERHLLLRHIA